MSYKHLNGKSQIIRRVPLEGRNEMRNVRTISIFIQVAVLLLSATWLNAEVKKCAQPQIVGDKYIRVASSPNDWKKPPWLGSPSIAKLSSGRLLVCYDHFAECDHKTSFISASDDNGKSWTKIATIKPLFWPSLFTCKSGLYVIGVTEGGQGSVVIYRSADEGKTWSKPTILTTNLSCHVGNTLVLVSGGRITTTCEIRPTSPYFAPTVTTSPVSVEEDDLDAKKIIIDVKSPPTFVPHMLVCLYSDSSRLHCRVLGVDRENRRLILMPERWADRRGDLHNSKGPWHFEANTRVKVVSGTLGSRRDFLVLALDAEESADLLNPSSWRQSNFVGLPAYTHARAVKEVFGFDFIARDDQGRAGGDSSLLYRGWLEGTPVRLEHPGGSGKILNLMRMAQNTTCNISARVVIDDAGKKLKLNFDRLAFDPGLGCTHACIRYDSVKKLYWMTSNVNRDSQRKSKFRNPTQERSNLALFYSRNCADWFMAGLIAYSVDWVHSYHYPHFIIDGNDLLVIARSHVESPLTEYTVNQGGSTADHHDSNAVTFHRVRDFRDLVNERFIYYRTE